MRVDPEQMLKHDRISTLGRIEEAGADDSFSKEQGNGNADDRRGEDLDPGGGIEGPGKQRDAHPGHALGPQTMNRSDEVKAGENRRETENKDRHGG